MKIYSRSKFFENINKHLKTAECTKLSMCTRRRAYKDAEEMLHYVISRAGKRNGKGESEIDPKLAGLARFYWNNYFKYMKDDLYGGNSPGKSCRSR